MDISAIVLLADKIQIAEGISSAMWCFVGVVKPREK